MSSIDREDSSIKRDDWCNDEAVLYLLRETVKLVEGYEEFA